MAVAHDNALVQSRPELARLARDRPAHDAAEAALFEESER